MGKLNRAVSSHLEPGGKGINVARDQGVGRQQYCAYSSAGTNGRIMKDIR